MLKTSPSFLSQIPLLMLQHWQVKLLQARQRGLLVLQGNETQGLSMADEVCQQLMLKPIWAHRDQGQSTNHIKRFVGQEHDAVVYNAYQKFSANHLALLAGTVKAGGLLIIVSASKSVMASERVAQGLNTGFVDYWFECLAKSSAVAWFHQESRHWSWPEMASLPRAPKFNGLEQQQAIAAVMKTVTGRSRSPLLLLAKRGRGKSAALGMAAAKLAQQQKTVLVTGPSEQAVKTLFAHYQKGTSKPLEFWPIDKLLLERPVSDVVLVDEAASIPVAQLQSLSCSYNRLVFATTLDGYEGSGQGFLLHFQPFLQARFARWRRCVMYEAIRFSSFDRLESFIDQSFLLAAKFSSLPAIATKNTPKYLVLDAKILLQQPQLLSAVFALLGLAHYQTSADDLQFLLEAPGVRLLAALQDKQVVGVLLAVDEGGFSEQAIDALGSKPRRLPGHILPQQLLMQGEARALGQRYCRVVRLAIHPDCRRQKIASRLLGLLSETVTVDLLGASFAATSAVLAFWQQAGFKLALLGSKKSTASACYTAVCLKPLTATGQDMLGQVTGQFHERLMTQLLLYNQDILPDCLPMLFRQGQLSLTLAEVSQVGLFCQQRIALEVAHWALAKQLCCYFRQGLILQEAQYCIAEKLLLNTPFDVLAKRYKLPGRKAIEGVMRQFFNEQHSR